jgi:hypothetical protein
MGLNSLIRGPEEGERVLGADQERVLREMEESSLLWSIYRAKTKSDHAFEGMRNWYILSLVIIIF